MKDFLFRPEQARTPVGVLSGGERARLTLARAFARPSNLLVLDEPTNRPRSRDARPVAGETGRVCRHGAAGQPRPRLPRSRRDIGHRQRTQGPLDRVRRRLHRHARAGAAARRGSLSAKARAVKQSAPDIQRKRSTFRRLPRMNFNDQRTLETLPDQIAAFPTQIAGLNAALADPDLYCTRCGAVPRCNGGPRDRARRTGGSRGAVAETRDAPRGDRSSRTTVLMRYRLRAS